MEISSEQEYTNEELRRVGDMVHTTIAYEFYQLDVIYGEAEMTPEIFMECLNACIRIDNGKEFYKLCESFPQFLNDIAVHSF